MGEMIPNMLCFLFMSRAVGARDECNSKDPVKSHIGSPWGRRDLSLTLLLHCFRTNTAIYKEQQRCGTSCHL